MHEVLKCLIIGLSVFQGGRIQTIYASGYGHSLGGISLLMDQWLTKPLFCLRKRVG